jgi:GNAT superfamily N-acetyltransferase
MTPERLTTGWEPEVPAGDSLLRAFVLTMADRTEGLARAAGGATRRTDTAVFADGGSPIVFDNGVILLAPIDAAGARTVVDEALDFFPADRPFVVFSAWPIPEAGDLGIDLMGHPPFMFRPAGPPAHERDTGLEVREVTDAAGLDVFWRTLADAYPMPGDDSVLAHPGVLDSGIHLWVGYEGDRPVGTSVVYVAHGANDVEWISVFDDCRGKGYGEALTWVATRADPDLPAVLIASDPGQPVYERMGFLRLTRLSMWFRPAGDG